MSPRQTTPHSDSHAHTAAIHNHSYSTPPQSPSPVVRDSEVEPQSNVESNIEPGLEARSTKSKPSSSHRHLHSQSQSDSHKHGHRLGLGHSHKHGHKRSKSSVYPAQAQVGLDTGSTDTGAGLNRGGGSDINNNNHSSSSNVGNNASHKEKHFRLHLSGKQLTHVHLRDREREREGEAEAAQRPRRTNGGHDKADPLPHLVAGLRKEGERKVANSAAQARGRNQSGYHGHAGYEALSSSKKSSKVISSRMMSSKTMATSRDAEITATEAENKALAIPVNGGQTGAQRQEALKEQNKQKTAFEEELERSDKLRRQRRFGITAADVAKKDEEINQAAIEIRERLDDVNSKGTDMARGLDYAYYNLLEKLGHVMNTIHSFHSLAQQGQQLIAHFDEQSKQLDRGTTAKITSFSRAFAEREAKLARLEAKGKQLSTKAEKLGMRLEQARAAVQEWERKEDKSKQVWSRFWSGIFWSSVAVALVLCLATAYKEVGLLGRHHNATLDLDAGPADNSNSSVLLQQLAGAQLPDEVRTLLEEIENNRSRKQKGYTATPVLVTDQSAEKDDEVHNDNCLHVLDEL